MPRPTSADVLRIAALTSFALAATVHGALQLEPPPTSASAWLRWIGPLPEALNRRALDRLQQASHALRAGKLSRYEELAASAATALRASLAADPVQPEAALQLLALDAELDPSTALERRAASIVALAGEHAPTRLQLGRLMLRRGLEGPALDHYRAAVRSRPTLAADAVADLRVALEDAEAVVRALPPDAEVLLALRPDFAGRPLPYLRHLDRLIEDDAARGRLLPTYTATAIAADRTRSLLDGFERWSLPRERRPRAEWQQQRAAALAAAGQFDEALGAAVEAVRLDPTSRRLEQQARVEIHLGRGEQAARSARRAIDGAERSRLPALYALLAEAHEAAGDPQRADAARRRAAFLGASS